MKLCLLASGSSGNCAYAAAGETQILIDAGISLSRIVSQLEAIGADPGRIDALILSHEHGDHCREARRVAFALGCSVHVSARTLSRLRRELTHYERTHTFQVGETLHIGDLQLQTFRVFHDAVEPCGFLVEGPSHCGPGKVKLAWATDLGVVPRTLIERWRACAGLVIEANHDLGLLLGGSYPWDLKQRIRSPVGHLSNDAAAEAISVLAQHGRLRKAVLAHLSENNNRPELALETVMSRLDGLFGCEVIVAPRERRSELIVW